MRTLRKHWGTRNAYLRKLCRVSRWKKLLISVRRVVEYQIHGTILTIVLNLLTTNVKRWFCFRQKNRRKRTWNFYLYQKYAPSPHYARWRFPRQPGGPLWLFVIRLRTVWIGRVLLGQDGVVRMDDKERDIRAHQDGRTTLCLANVVAVPQAVLIPRDRTRKIMVRVNQTQHIMIVLSIQSQVHQITNVLPVHRSCNY